MVEPFSNIFQHKNLFKVSEQSVGNSILGRHIVISTVELVFIRTKTLPPEGGRGEPSF